MYGDVSLPTWQDLQCSHHTITEIFFSAASQISARGAMVLRYTTKDLEGYIAGNLKMKLMLGSFWERPAQDRKGETAKYITQ